MCRVNRKSPPFFGPIYKQTQKKEKKKKQNNLQYPTKIPEEANARFVYPAVFAICKPINTQYPAAALGNKYMANNNQPRSEVGSCHNNTAAPVESA